jgi:flagellar motor switch protein FliM
MGNLLQPGEQVVSMTTYREFLMVVGSMGTLIMGHLDPLDGTMIFHIEARL